MYAVPSKVIRERLDTIARYFRAVNMEDSASIIDLALIEIMQKEEFFETEDKQQPFHSKITGK